MLKIGPNQSQMSILCKSILLHTFIWNEIDKQAWDLHLSCIYLILFIYLEWIYMVFTKAMYSLFANPVHVIMNKYV